MFLAVDDFVNARTRRDVARVLNISYGKMIYHLYKSPLENKYREFSVPKKSGGERVICAPNGVIKSLQRRLADLLYVIHDRKPSAHGCIPKRGIRTNAEKHARSRYVINFDIKDFFPSINFGRVRGIFMAHPLSFPEEVATVLAHICCFNGVLPQGAPTSPVVANMIARRMDREMQELSKKNGFMYSRYVDDITLSTKKKIVPEDLLEKKGNVWVVGSSVVDVVEGNGFSINEKKTRISGRWERQEVTGLTVNRFPNVRRSFVRQVRAMLHAWERYGYADAEDEFNNKWDRKRRDKAADFRRVVKGKIDFIGMVKGVDDAVYGALRKKFIVLESRDFPGSERRYSLPADKEEYLDDAVFIIEFEWEKDGEYDCSQGTCFYLSGVGFVTCAHVLPPPDVTKISSAIAFRWEDVAAKYDVSVLVRNDDVDLALLEIDVEVVTPLHSVRHMSFLGDQSRVVVVGFPNYSPGNTLYKHWGRVTQRRRVSGVDRIIVSCLIVEGNSGGPVLNERYHVVGVAVTGVGDQLRIGATHNHGFIPIDSLKYLKAS